MVVFSFFNFNSLLFFKTISLHIGTNFYNFFLTIFKENISSLRAHKYIPLFMVLFLFLLLLNLSGLIFYDVSITSHLAITLFFSFSLFMGFFCVAILNFDYDYIFKFIENNINIYLKILLFFIEIISFFIRPFSLGIRLFTNMLSGHVSLHIFISFYIYMIKNYSYLIFIPLAIITAVFILEIFISLIQAYVFVVLLIIYLKDMYFLHD